MNIRKAGAKDKILWDNYVANHPQGIAYQLSGWQEAVKTAYGFKSCSLIAEEQNRIKGVLPLTLIFLPFTGGNLVSLPYCDAGGPLADSPATELSLIRHALEYAGSRHLKKLVIRSTHRFAGLNPDLTINEQKVRMILNLPDQSEKLLASLKAKVRSQVKKACKNDLTSVMGSINLLDDFYSVFSENMRDLGSPVHSKKWIYNILKAYGNRAHISVVYTPDGQPAAAGIILCHPKLVSIPWASSLRRFNKSNPNMMLYWTFLKFAADNGYPRFDFGRSTPGEGTFRFKKQWGAEPSSLHWASFNTREDYSEKLCPESEKNSEPSSRPRLFAESAIRKMPVPVSTALGTLIRKYISL